jgi:hypothetical protein
MEEAFEEGQGPHRAASDDDYDDHHKDEKQFT